MLQSVATSSMVAMIIGIIAQVDAGHEELAQPRHAKDHLDEDRPGDQVRDLREPGW